MPSDFSEPREYILAGPRWDSMLQAVQDSIVILKHLDSGQLGLARDMLNSYESIVKELDEGGHVRPEHWHGWARSDLWDSALSNNLSSALAGENAIRNVQAAEDTLNRIELTCSFLIQPVVPFEEQASGWTNAFIGSLREILTQLAVRIRSGEYLRAEDLANWVIPLEGVGVTRQAMPVVSYRNPHEAIVMKIGYIERFSGDQWWTELREIDRYIVNLADRDLS